MDDTVTEMTEGAEARMRATTPRTIRSRIGVRRVQKVAGRAAIVAWVSAMFGTVVSRSVNDVVFTLIAVGAVAFTAAVTARFWSDVCNGELDLPGGNTLRDTAVIASLLAFVCLWGVCVITVVIGGALALWAAIFNL